MEVAEERIALRGQRLQLLFGQLAHVGVARGRELFGSGQVAHDVLVLAEPIDQRLELRERFRVFAVLGRIALDLGRPEQAHQVFVALFFGG